MKFRIKNSKLFIIAVIAIIMASFIAGYFIATKISRTKSVEKSNIANHFRMFYEGLSLDTLTSHVIQKESGIVLTDYHFPGPLGNFCINFRGTYEGEKKWLVEYTCEPDWVIQAIQEKPGQKATVNS